jgi:hypothetical protein
VAGAKPWGSPESYLEVKEDEQNFATIWSFLVSPTLRWLHGFDDSICGGIDNKTFEVGFLFVLLDGLKFYLSKLLAHNYKW